MRAEILCEKLRGLARNLANLREFRGTSQVVRHDIDLELSESPQASTSPRRSHLERARRILSQTVAASAQTWGQLPTRRILSQVGATPVQQCLEGRRTYCPGGTYGHITGQGEYSAKPVQQEPGRGDNSLPGDYSAKWQPRRCCIALKACRTYCPGGSYGRNNGQGEYSAKPV